MQVAGLLQRPRKLSGAPLLTKRKLLASSHIATSVVALPSPNFFLSTLSTHGSRIRLRILRLVQAFVCLNSDDICYPLRNWPNELEEA
jgi:hypothetical protein